jgi:acyl-CoA thioesterase-1
MSVFGFLPRSAVIAFASLLGTIGVGKTDDTSITIVTLGDSLINGNGLSDTDAFPARLQAALIAKGRPVMVTSPGFRDTSKMGLLWLTKQKGGQALLANPAGHAVILELGQNDCGRFAIGQTRANLDGIVAALVEKGIPVLVVGTAAYDYCGKDYAADFPGLFQYLSTKYGELLYADFKDGVTGHPELLQADGDHPNSAGEAVVVERMLPSVLALMERVKP